MSVLEVDRKGLAKKLGKRPKHFIIHELLSNAWDENVTKVSVHATMLPGRPICRVVVEDDCPEGFADLRSVYTLFRDSKKAHDPTKRGRFELGEKLVIAMALSARIETTKGTILIEGEERSQGRKRRSSGSVFMASFHMSRPEYKEMCAHVRMLIVPEGIETTFNGERILPRAPLHTFSTVLQTIRADGDGMLRSTERIAEVRVYEPLAGESAHLYELGIPVLETQDKWHYSVQQRVPVNWERNNVPPSYLKTLRVEVLNAMHAQLESADAGEPWVSQALADERCEPSAGASVIAHRFGDKRVIADPSDPEGTKIAMSQGYTVIPGGALSREQWANVREHGWALAAGRVTPSPKVYDPNGEPETVLQPGDWTGDMHRIAAFAAVIFEQLTGTGLVVRIVDCPKASWAANFGTGCLTLNFGRLGHAWFAHSVRSEPVLDLLLHEYCHHTVSDHLSAKMHETATSLGARLTGLALECPYLFVDAVTVR